MIDIDWASEPEATHCSASRNPQAIWYIVGNNSHLWKRGTFGRWIESSVLLCHDGLIARPQPKPWSGPEDGLPPVGFVCEAELYKGGGWIEGFVAYYGKAHFVFESSQLTVGVEIAVKIRTSSFRPLRTEEQLAAEQRETAIREIMDIADVDCRVTAGKLVDAGFKREVV